MDAGRLLSDLLKKNSADGLVRQLADGLSKLLPSRHTTNLISLNHLRSVYHIRATINERNGNLVQGFAELLPALAAFEGQVALHIFSEQQEHRWLVFTDESVTQFIGILKLPTHTEMQTRLTN